MAQMTKAKIAKIKKGGCYDGQVPDTAASAADSAAGAPTDGTVI